MSTQTYKGGKSGWIKSYIEANKNSKISIQTYKAEKSGWIKYYIEDMKLIKIIYSTSYTYAWMQSTKYRVNGFCSTIPTRVQKDCEREIGSSNNKCTCSNQKGCFRLYY